MGKQNMVVYMTLESPDVAAFYGGMREYQREMVRQILAAELEQPGPRDWSPRTGRCLCPKHQA